MRLFKGETVYFLEKKFKLSFSPPHDCINKLSYEENKVPSLKPEEVAGSATDKEKTVLCSPFKVSLFIQFVQSRTQKRVCLFAADLIKNTPPTKKKTKTTQCTFTVTQCCVLIIPFL